MARWSVPATSMATRAARCDGSSGIPAPSPSERTMSREAGSTSTSTYRSRAMASVSKPGPRLADDAGARARTPTRYSGRSSPGGIAPLAGPSQGPWTSLHHHDGSGTVLASRNETTSIWVPRENMAVPTRLPLVLPGGTGESPLVEATVWPGHASSHAPSAVTMGTGCALPPQVTVTAPTTWSAVATVTGTTAASVAPSSFSTTGRVKRNGSGIWRSSGGGRVVVVVLAGTMGGGVGCPSTAASTRTGRPCTERTPARIRQAPACEVYPDLTPTTPLEPTSVTVWVSVPTSGRVTDGMATPSAKLGSAIPAAATRRQSEAVDTE